MGSHGRVMTFGSVFQTEWNVFEITELPTGVWTENYKNRLMNMSVGTNKNIEDYENHSSDDRVKFIVKLNRAQVRKGMKIGFYEYFSLMRPITYAETMVLFDAENNLKVYESTGKIAKDHFDIRLQNYVERKKFQLMKMKAKMEFISNRTRFILDIIENNIRISNRTKNEIIGDIINGGYKPDPIKVWKKKLSEENQYFRSTNQFR